MSPRIRVVTTASGATAVQVVWGYRERNPVPITGEYAGVLLDAIAGGFHRPGRFTHAGTSLRRIAAETARGNLEEVPQLHHHSFRAHNPCPNTIS